MHSTECYPIYVPYIPVTQTTVSVHSTNKSNHSSICAILLITSLLFIELISCYYADAQLQACVGHMHSNVVCHIVCELVGVQLHAVDVAMMKPCWCKLCKPKTKIHEKGCTNFCNDAGVHLVLLVVGCSSPVCGLW